MKFIKSVLGFLWRLAASALLIMGILVALNALSAKIMQGFMRDNEPAYVTCFSCTKDVTVVNVYFGGYSDQATSHSGNLVGKVEGASVFVDYNRWGYDPEAIARYVVKYLEKNGLADREIRVFGFSMGMKPATMLANKLYKDGREVTLIGINPCFGADALRGDLGLESQLAKSKDSVSPWTVFVKDLIGWAKFMTLDISPSQFENYSIATVVEQVASLSENTYPDAGVRVIVLMAGDDDTINNKALREAYEPLSAEIVEIPKMRHTTVSWQPEPYIEALHELGIK